jgi:uncharacterized protein with von Willebrand factor type A (vWA) domain
MAAPRPLSGTEGRLAANIVHFARALRRAGLRVGPAQVVAAVEAVAVAGFARKTDFYHILRATMICRAEDFEAFDQVFALFWRDPEFIEKMIHLMSPLLRKEGEERAREAAARRAREAMGGEPPGPGPETPVRETIELDARDSATSVERLRAMDFEQMTAAELAEATRALRALRLPVRPVPTRRAHPAPRGAAADLRATLRRALRRGGEIDRIPRRAPRPRPPDLVAICDISGSMTAYSRMLMRFLHALAWSPGREVGRVHAFTFGTRLTNVTRALRRRDPDAALAAAGQAARDWEGGTRIGAALHAFNRDWSRRVLGRGAVVVLITDGLERESPEVLGAEAERLHLSCRELVWLNPLLRWDGFTPRAGGIRALLPHVDQLRPCHSLQSLVDLAEVLSGADRRG